jgi:ribonuclease Z
MNASSIRRSLTALAAIVFAGVAVGMWADPVQSARAFGLEAIGPMGRASLRADLGGLFAALALLCGAAAWTQLRSWQLAAAAVMGAIVAGRGIAWIAGGPSGDAASFAVEIAVFAILASTGALSRRSLMVTAGILAAVVTGVAALPIDQLRQRIYDEAAVRMAGTVNDAPLADDALRVAVCGSSAPLPSTDRAKTCVAVFAGGKYYVVDVGPESVENLVMWGIPLSSIGGVMLTHFHSDHIGDLGELNLQTWANGRPAPLRVYGGPGVESVVKGFNAAYRLDQAYRTEHHTAQVMVPETWPMIAQPIAMPGAKTAAMDRWNVVLTDGALTVTAYEVDHAPIAPAYAYRFDYQGRSVFVTGDLKYNASLAKAARGADVMISEAIAMSMTQALGAGARAGGRDRAAAIMHDIEDYHITPEQAAAAANDAGVKLLVFYHLLPAPDGRLPRNLFTQGIDAARKGDWTMADDGSLYTMPIGSTEVRRGEVIDR